MKRIYIIAAIVLCSCSPRIVTVEKERILNHETIRYDSIYVSDTTFLRSHDDTVFLDKIRYIYKYKHLHDTTLIVQRDSIPYPVEVVKEVNHLNTLQRTMIWGFWIFVALFVLRIKRLRK